MSRAEAIERLRRLKQAAEQIQPDVEWLTSFTKGAVQFWKNVREKL